MKQRFCVLAALLVGSAASPASAGVLFGSFTKGELCELGTISLPTQMNKEVLEANRLLKDLFVNDGFIADWDKDCRYRINIGVEGNYNSNKVPVVKVTIFFIVDERNTVLFVGGRQVKLHDSLLLWSTDYYTTALESDATLNDYSKLMAKIMFDIFKMEWNYKRD